MSKCQCDLRTKLVGDGCRYCNAQEYIDNLIEALEEQRTWHGLTDEEIAEALGDEIDSVYMTDFRRVEAKLKEKNT